MKKIIAVALIVTFVLSAAIIYTRSTGQVVSEKKSERRLAFVDVGKVDIKEGEMISMEIFHDIGKKSI